MNNNNNNNKKDMLTMTSYCCNELKHVRYVKHHIYITTTACLWSVHLTEPSVYLFAFRVPCYSANEWSS